MAGLGLLLCLHFLFVELTLGVLGFLGTLEVVSLNSATGTTLQAVAFALALLFWLLLVCCGRDNATLTTCFGDEPEKRGAGILQARVLYFFACLGFHFVGLIAWIVYAIKFGALDPINETTNVGAFIVRGRLHLVMLVSFLAIFAVLIVDMRTLKRSKKQTENK